MRLSTTWFVTNLSRLEIILRCTTNITSDQNLTERLKYCNHSWLWNSDKQENKKYISISNKAIYNLVSKESSMFMNNVEVRAKRFAERGCRGKRVVKF